MSGASVRIVEQHWQVNLLGLCKPLAKRVGASPTRAQQGPMTRSPEWRGRTPAKFHQCATISPAHLLRHRPSPECVRMSMAAASLGSPRQTCRALAKLAERSGRGPQHRRPLCEMPPMTSPFVARRMYRSTCNPKPMCASHACLLACRVGLHAFLNIPHIFRQACGICARLPQHAGTAGPKCHRHDSGHATDACW